MQETHMNGERDPVNRTMRNETKAPAKFFQALRETTAA